MSPFQPGSAPSAIPRVRSACALLVDAGPLGRAIISIANARRIRVIAEGVETESQRDILLAAGCDYGQGHFFCPPVEASAFEAFVSAVT